ncbi:MAG TPA: energy transducer TonB [Methylomirabilota bacterium]|nr:energy transducer TonB [Methylomirabilota bacterium]
MIDERLAGWPLWLSVGLHALGLGAASSVVALAHHPPERALVPVEVVRLEPPPPAPPEKAKMPPRVVSEPTPTTRSKPTYQNLMVDPTPRVEHQPDPAPTAPDRRFMASAQVPGPALPIPAAPGAGGLLLPSPEIPGARSGSPRTGQGLANATGEGVTSLARPLSGYQTTPRYPEAARREGIEGVVTLRFEVLANGKVGTVQVQQSAGREDLDRAAVEAVRTWLFEPARRGKEAVAVWVTVPVRFELHTR